MVCRRCFRENANLIGFHKYRWDRLCKKKHTHEERVRGWLGLPLQATLKLNFHITFNRFVCLSSSFSKGFEKLSISFASKTYVFSHIYIYLIGYINSSYFINFTCYIPHYLFRKRHRINSVTTPLCFLDSKLQHPIFWLHLSLNLWYHYWKSCSH